MTNEQGLSVFERAVIFATQAHRGMRRKLGGIPYIAHPLECASIVATVTTDEEVMAAAVLHDVLEDTEVSADVLREEFGDRVTELVCMETEDKRRDIPASESWYVRKTESLKELEETDDDAVKILWLADKLSNMRSFYRQHLLEGDAMWQHFNQKDVKMQEWYYRKISELLIDLKQYPAMQEYDRLTNCVFGADPKGE